MDGWVGLVGECVGGLSWVVCRWVGGLMDGWMSGWVWAGWPRVGT